jgi:hypothetical protein
MDKGDDGGSVCVCVRICCNAPLMTGSMMRRCVGGKIGSGQGDFGRW